MLVDDIKFLLEKMEDYLLEPTETLRAELIEEICVAHNEISQHCKLLIQE